MTSSLYEHVTNILKTNGCVHLSNGKSVYYNHVLNPTDTTNIDINISIYIKKQILIILITDASFYAIVGTAHFQIPTECADQLINY